jgi:ribosomal protein S18 acetylase RimI-like enzyme
VAEFYVPERVRSELAVAMPHWGGWVVAEDGDGTPVAAGGGIMTASGVGELFVLYADPRMRRRGGGSAVLDLISAQHREAGACGQEVAVQEGNELGLGFYGAQGFVQVGRRDPFHPAETKQTLLLRRDL